MLVRQYILAQHMLLPPPLPEGIVQLPPPESPPLWTKLTRLKGELVSWRDSGGGIVSRAVRSERLAKCKACPYYRANGNLMFGECRAPGCGCTRAKLWLATSKCPHPTEPRW